VREGRTPTCFRYSIYRLLQIIPALLLVSIFVFSMVHLLPGDVIDALAGEGEAYDPAVRAALEKELGLDKPIYVQ
jgi:ABC-type dipeptide/oligopeptide/nickel transport system permease component